MTFKNIMKFLPKSEKLKLPSFREPNSLLLYKEESVEIKPEKSMNNFAKKWHFLKIFQHYVLLFYYYYFSSSILVL